MLYATRPIECSVFAAAKSRGLSPALARILAGRLQTEAELDVIISPKLRHIPPPSQLKDCDRAIERLVQAIDRNEHIGILTDYDADGLTSHAVIYQALIRFGVSRDLLSHWIGHRLDDGYGISTNLVDKVLSQSKPPTVVISADCGSSDAENIARMHEAGISVIVTDHHRIPSQGPPSAAHACVNPNRSDCGYPDKDIAGCMVAWLVMSGLRTVLIANEQICATTPKLGDLLDYVALGTVADCVSFRKSETNRAVVNSGIQLIREGIRPCWSVVIEEFSLSQRDITAEILGFQIAPRLNARGRIGHSMRGFEFLIAASIAKAFVAFQELDAANRTRRSIEKQMVQRAKPLAERQKIQGRSILIVLLEEGHPGVQGIVASRLVDAFGLPAVCFTPIAESDLLTGSMRSASGLDAKNLLDEVANMNNALIIRHGGHKGACGLKLKREVFDDFCDTLYFIIRKVAPELRPQPRFLIDGELLPEDLSPDFVDSIDSLGPYGRGFEQPIFVGVFEVISHQLVGKKPTHLSLILNIENYPVRGIWFNAFQDRLANPIQTGDWIQCIYRPSIDQFRGVGLSLVIQHCVVVGEGQT